LKTNVGKLDVHHYIGKKGFKWRLITMEIRLIEDTGCAHDEHEMKYYPRIWYHAKPVLSKGTRLEVIKEWTNFYGSYYRCKHEFGEYDIPVEKAEIIC